MRNQSHQQLVESLQEYLFEKLKDEIVEVAQGAGFKIEDSKL